MSDEIVFDPTRMTIGDLEDFEDLVGESIDVALSPKQVYEDGEKVFDPETGRPVKEINIPPKTIKVLVWLIKRQDDPSFTLEDARNVKISDLNLAGNEQAEDPEKAKN